MTANKNVQPTIEPDFDAILQHLELLFGRALKGLIEIGWTNSDTHKLQHAELFDVGDLDKAAERAIQKNRREFQNVYVGSALRNPDTAPGARAKDEDFLAGWCLHVDLDDQGSPDKARSICAEKGIQPPLVVTTGRHPHERAQLWFPLEEPVTDPDAYKVQLKALAEILGGDTTVTNPSRVMRLGGTVAWPIKKGRITEKTELHHFSDQQQRFYFEEINKSFPATPLAIGEPVIERQSFNFDTGAPLNAEEVTNRILAGDHWHENMVRLVGHWISKGWSDSKIILDARSFTLPGYTDADTDKEVQRAIDGGRRKWAVPDPKIALAGEPASPVGPDGALILGSAEFVGGFVAPDYIVDGILQRRYLYCLTAKTGHGKTAVLLLLAAMVATGQPFNNADTSVGRVCYFAGENPDDVRARWLLMASVFGFDANSIDVHFIPGPFNIPGLYNRIAIETKTLGGFDMVIVDTSAAYFQGDEENSNTQLGRHARDLRNLTKLSGGPSVVVACHPIKNASKENLLPRGGGAFIAEVDGNLTLWSDDDVTTELSWTGKFRGPQFEPKSFKMEPRTDDAIKDSKGRQMPSVVALPVSEEDAQDSLAKAIRDEDTVILAMLDDPKFSLAQIAVSAGWVSAKSGTPLKSKVERAIRALKAEKFVTKRRKKWVLTEQGKTAAVKIESADKLGLLA